MANAKYTKFGEALLGAAINLSTDNLKAVLVDTGAYTPNLGTHQYLSDIPSGARIATSGNLASKSITNGIFDAADVTFAAVSGATCEAVVIYQDTGSAATSRLIAYIDTATGLPVAPNGSDITVAWDNGASKIFAI